MSRWFYGGNSWNWGNGYRYRLNNYDWGGAGYYGDGWWWRRHRRHHHHHHHYSSSDY